jgi:hypothetical protein
MSSWTFMTLKQVGVTDGRARAAAVVVRDDVKITQLEVSIDERLARLEKDLSLLSGGGVMTAFLLLGGEFFKAVFGADTQTLSATLRARPVTVARAHISGAASAGRVKMASSQSMLDGVSQQMSRHCCPLWLTATK